MFLMHNDNIYRFCVDIPHQMVPVEVAELLSSTNFVLDDHIVLEAMEWLLIG